MRCANKLSSSDSELPNYLKGATSGGRLRGQSWSNKIQSTEKSLFYAMEFGLHPDDPTVPSRPWDTSFFCPFPLKTQQSHAPINRFCSHTAEKVDSSMSSIGDACRGVGHSVALLRIRFGSGGLWLCSGTVVLNGYSRAIFVMRLYFRGGCNSILMCLL